MDFTLDQLSEAIAAAIVKTDSQGQSGTYNDATDSVKGFSDGLKNATGIAGKAFGALDAVAQKAASAAQNRSGDIGTGMRDVLNIKSDLAIPFTEAARSLEASDSMARAGVIIESIQAIGDTAAVLNLTQDQLADFATNQMDELRATGLLGNDAIDQLVQLRDKINKAGEDEFGVEEFRALGIELDKLANYSSTFAGLYGPAMQGNIDGMSEALEENIRRQNMLAQTTGMSVEAQIAATEQIMKTPGALARQMDLITNPKMTQALVGFSNTVAAIGASDLAEGFISGVGLPTPGNEIEAALKPMTTALLGELNDATARGDEAAVKRLSAELQVVYAQESQGVMQELGRFAPYLGAEFGFLQKDLDRQRATMLGIASDPNFVGGQQAAAQQQIQVRLDDSVLSALAGLESSQADMSTQLLKSINMLAGSGGLVENTANVAAALGDTTATFLESFQNMFQGDLSDLQMTANQVSIEAAMVEIEGKIDGGTASDEEKALYAKLEKVVVEFEAIAAGSLQVGEATKLLKELQPLLGTITEKRQTATVDEYNASGTTLEQTSPGLIGQGFAIIGGAIKSLNPFDGGANTPAAAPADDQQSALIPSLLEENNSKLDIMNAQLIKLTGATGTAGAMTARAIDKNATFQGMEQRIT